MKIAYVTSCDARDRRSWSGLHYHISQALQKHCGDVSYIGPLSSRLQRWLTALDRVTTRLLGKRYDYLHSTLLARRFAGQIRRRLSAHHYDVIFAAAASTEIAYLETDLPVVYLSDTTFSLINEYYPVFSNLLPLSAWEGRRIESRAVKRAGLLLYSSEWAARSAHRDHAADPTRTFVVPFGANIDADDVVERHRLFEKEPTARCRLLFLGVDWTRKGGDIAFQTLLELERRGVDAELTICGCVPPNGLRHDRMHVIPFLDKNDKEQRATFVDLLLSSTFLLVPTRADCTPLAFCEASAYGLPVVSTATGGVPDTVRDGESGILLPLSATGADYADRIAAIHADLARYQRLRTGSREAFESTLNWDAWGRSVRDLLATRLQRDLPATATPPPSSAQLHDRRLSA